MVHSRGLILVQLRCNFFWQQDVLCPWFLKAHSVRSFCGLAYLKKLCKTGCIHALLIVSLWHFESQSWLSMEGFLHEGVDQRPGPLATAEKGRWRTGLLCEAKGQVWLLLPLAVTARARLVFFPLSFFLALCGSLLNLPVFIDYTGGQFSIVWRARDASAKSCCTCVWQCISACPAHALPFAAHRWFS